MYLFDKKEYKQQEGKIQEKITQTIRSLFIDFYNERIIRSKKTKKQISKHSKLWSIKSSLQTTVSGKEKLEE